MKFFISHASEDKADFVEPLAEALMAAGYDVWYDKFALTIGDSIRQKINQGLLECDYGVVVLSPAFFAKKWPQAELDGLFALETTTRKIILPVWKDLDSAGVAKFSPMLAGRLGARAAGGVAQVVLEIQKAVELDGRRQEIVATESAVDRLQRIGKTIDKKRADEQHADSPSASQTIAAEFDRAMLALETQLAEISRGSSALQMTIKHPPVPRYLTVHSSVGVSFGLHLSNLAINTSRGAELPIEFYQLGRLNPRTHERAPTKKIDSAIFRPVFSSGRPGWQLTASDRFYTTDELVAWVLNEFAKYIERQQATR